MEEIEEKVVLTIEQALDCIVIKDNQVHNFVSSYFGVVGADWDIEEVRKCLNEASSIEIGGQGCRGLGHGLAVRKGNQDYFFEADNDKLDKYDKGESL